jgi:DNA polymerase
MKDELKELVSDIKEQALYLSELGVETLKVDLPKENHPAAADVPARIYETGPPVPIQTPDIPVLDIPAKASPAGGSRLNTLPSLARRGPSPSAKTAAKGGGSVPLPAVQPPDTVSSIFGDISGLPESDETMEGIWADIGNCTRCPLHEGRTQVVHTVGNYQSDLMFIGEAPGADEDAKGEPFVGRAGQLLNKIIEAIGMKREEVCIANINRCRPPGNRQPTLPEAHTCKPFLLREIAVIRPKVIVVMGLSVGPGHCPS